VAQNRPAMDRVILNSEIRSEQDIVLARQRARQIAGLVGFERQDQTRIATAVSEIARNAFEYASGGRVTFALEAGPGDRRPTDPGYRGLPSVSNGSLVVVIEDNGPGIQDLQSVLDGRYQSPTGMGLGILGARRLTDEFHIESVPGEGTRVRLTKNLPPSAPFPNSGVLARISAELARTALHDPLTEIARQNQELLQSLEALRARQAEVERLNRELEDTNRGVVALYTELDDKAGYLQRAAELKTSFLSNMSHEFRTPLNAILSLSQLLLDRVDGELNSEQEKQVQYIRKAALDLSELVNDLLDLARVEAGKVVIRPSTFSVSELFGALRGMLRPLLEHNSAVSLIFDDASNIPPLESDEGKVSQILRNLISNALKFTEHGEVRVSARALSEGRVLFSVSDTGIGIAPQDQGRIFEEFTQVEGPIQRRVKGTGLGLPLSRKLTELLGGRIWVESELGRGSTFQVELPGKYSGPNEVSFVPEITRQLDPHRNPVLVVEDSPEVMFLYEKYLKGTEFQAIPARTLREAREALAKFRPAAVLLDILLEDESTWSFLGEIKEDPHTRSVPVIVGTVIDNQRKAEALGADAFGIKPLQREWLLSQLRRLGGRRQRPKVLVIDDDEISRYLLRGLLRDFPFEVLEARSGAEGVELARSEQPQMIFLDLVMPELDGFQTLGKLRAHPATANIPVIINSSAQLLPEQVAQLSRGVVAVLNKRGRSQAEALADLRRALSAAGLLPSAEDPNRG